jgi:stress responsive alpha/beta barrel protein
VIRRFETYAFLPGTSSEAKARLGDVLASSGRFIPEVLHSSVGWNRSEASAELVWEHVFESPESYRRYMVHPYHVDLIDRYVLADSPERVVHTATGAGLFGYHCDDDAMTAGPGRRLVLLDLDPATGTPAAEDLWSRLAQEAAASGALSTGSGANTLANTWFDATTPLPGPPPRWSHVWEAGYATLPADSWDEVLGGAPLRRVRELRYQREI